AGTGILLTAICFGTMLVGRDELFQIPAKTAAVFAMILAGMGLYISGTRVFNFISFKEKNDTYARELKVKQEKLKTYTRKFEVETSVVRNLLKALDADGISEMFTQIHRLKENQKILGELQMQLDREKENPRYQKASAQLPEMQKKAKSMDKEL